MRNALPAMIHVQTDFSALPGDVGIGVEASNATVPGDDRWHSNSGNELTVPPLEPYGPATRYFDVFTRGNKDCTWEASPAQPWVKLSQSSGPVGPSHPDTRVFISVDWKSAPPAPFSETVAINITPCEGMDTGSHVRVPVRARSVPSSFKKGFVESDGTIAFAGEHFSSIIKPSKKRSTATTRRNNDNDKNNNKDKHHNDKNKGKNKEPTYHTFPNYGRTSSGVGLVPLHTEKLPLAQAPALEYDLYLFTNHTAANVTLFLSPTLNYLGDASPLEYAIALFPAAAKAPSAEQVQHVQPVGPADGGDMPAGWDGAVGDAVWGRTGGYTTSGFAVPKEGAYKLRVWAQMPGVVVQKVVVDLGGLRASYLGPPESFYVGRDKVGGEGGYDGTSFLSGEGVVGGK
jgi:hypothetical protein